MRGIYKYFLSCILLSISGSLLGQDQYHFSFTGTFVGGSLSSEQSIKNHFFKESVSLNLLYNINLKWNAGIAYQSLIQQDEYNAVLFFPLGNEYQIIQEKDNNINYQNQLISGLVRYNFTPLRKFNFFLSILGSYYKRETTISSFSGNTQFTLSGLEDLMKSQKETYNIKNVLNFGGGSPQDYPPEPINYIQPKESFTLGMQAGIEWRLSRVLGLHFNISFYDLLPIMQKYDVRELQFFVDSETAESSILGIWEDETNEILKAYNFGITYRFGRKK